MTSRLELASNNKEDLRDIQKYLESLGWRVIEKKVVIHGDSFPGSYIIVYIEKEDD